MAEATLDQKIVFVTAALPRLFLFHALMKPEEIEFLNEFVKNVEKEVEDTKLGLGFVLAKHLSKDDKPYQMIMEICVFAYKNTRLVDASQPMSFETKVEVITSMTTTMRESYKYGYLAFSHSASEEQKKKLEDFIHKVTAMRPNDEGNSPYKCISACLKEDESIFDVFYEIGRLNWEG